MAVTPGTRKATAESRADRAETLRLYLEEKLTMDEITKVPGQPKTQGAISKRIAKALADREHPMIDEWRSMESARLEDERQDVKDLLKTAEDLDGSVKVYGTLLRYSERLAKLLGADLPVKVEVSGSSETEAEKQWAAQLAENRAIVAAQEARIKGTV